MAKSYNACSRLGSWFWYFSENENLTFRGNTLATKSMDTYMKMVGHKVCLFKCNLVSVTFIQGHNYFLYCIDHCQWCSRRKVIGNCHGEITLDNIVLTFTLCYMLSRKFLLSESYSTYSLKVPLFSGILPSSWGLEHEYVWLCFSSLPSHPPPSPFFSAQQDGSLSW